MNVPVKFIIFFIGNLTQVGFIREEVDKADPGNMIDDKVLSLRVSRSARIKGQFYYKSIENQLIVPDPDAKVDPRIQHGIKQFFILTLDQSQIKTRKKSKPESENPVWTE